MSIRPVLVAAALACALAPTSAFACQWEFYEKTYDTPAGPITLTHARCVSP